MVAGSAWVLGGPRAMAQGSGPTEKKRSEVESLLEYKAFWQMHAFHGVSHQLHHWRRTTLEHHAALDVWQNLHSTLMVNTCKQKQQEQWPDSEAQLHCAAAAAYIGSLAIKKLAMTHH